MNRYTRHEYEKHLFKYEPQRQILDPASMKPKLDN